MPVASGCAENTKEMFAVPLEALGVNISFTLKEMSVSGRDPEPGSLTKPDSPRSEPHKGAHQNQLGSRGPNKCVRPKAPCLCSLGGPHVLCSRKIGNSWPGSLLWSRIWPVGPRLAPLVIPSLFPKALEVIWLSPQRSWGTASSAAPASCRSGDRHSLLQSPLHSARWPPLSSARSVPVAGLVWQQLLSLLFHTLLC